MNMITELTGKDRNDDLKTMSPIIHELMEKLLTEAENTCLEYSENPKELKKLLGKLKIKAILYTVFPGIGPISIDAVNCYFFKLLVCSVLFHSLKLLNWLLIIYCY